MTHKKYFLIFLIFNLFFSNTFCFSLDTFTKSIYASINESEKMQNHLKKNIFETEYLILKYENPLNNFNSPSIHKMSFYINPKFYHNIISLDKSDKIDFYTLKNNILKHTSKSSYKISEPYTVIEDENNTIYERLEYFDEYLNVEEKNNTTKNYWYNLINEKPVNISKYPSIQDLTNISLFEINNAIKESFNKISKWNEDNSYELIFVYDKIKSKFLLNKIFVYYIKNETKSCKINISQMKFENAIFEQGDKIYKNFDLKNYIINENYINNTEYKIKISTNKKDSIYHNLMSLKFDEQTLNNFYNKSLKNNICFLIHYILTEDVYIERNEFLKRFEEILQSNGINKTMIKENVKYNLIASKFIEQELSSDLSEQAYFSFVLCTNKFILDKLNNTISFTIHFRYQPSLNSNSNKTHKSTIMPQPFVFISNDNIPKEKEILHEYIYTNNIIKEGKNNNDKLKIFEEEIKNKKIKIINQVKILNDNYQELIHQIPVGQKKYFLVVTFVTVVTSFCGFFIIFMGVMKYISAPEGYHKMKKIE